jgi:hypothetical protein
VGQGDVPPPPRALGRDPGLTSSDGRTGANRTLRSPRGPLPRCRPHAPADLALPTAPIALASLRGRRLGHHRAEAADPSTGRGHNNGSRTRLLPPRGMSRSRILLRDIHGAPGRTDTHPCAAPRALASEEQQARACTRSASSPTLEPSKTKTARCAPAHRRDWDPHPSLVEEHHLPLRALWGTASSHRPRTWSMGSAGTLDQGERGAVGLEARSSAAVSRTNCARVCAGLPVTARTSSVTRSS